MILISFISVLFLLHFLKQKMNLISIQIGIFFAFVPIEWTILIFNFFVSYKIENSTCSSWPPLSLTSPSPRPNKSRTLWPFLIWLNLESVIQNAYADSTDIYEYSLVSGLVSFHSVPDPQWQHKSASHHHPYTISSLMWRYFPST